MVKQIQKATISVPQIEANKVITKSLKANDKKTFSELVKILKGNFNGVTDSQCSGLIHRAHAKEDAILVKEDKDYRLKNENDLEMLPVGLDKVRQIIEKAINDMDNIGVGEFSTTDFETYKSIKGNLKKLI